MFYSFFISSLFATSLVGQVTISKQEEEKLIMQRRVIKLDSIFIRILTGTYIKTDFNNFLKNDTIYYPDKTILRTAEVSNGYLNGKLNYYNKDGKIYILSQLKNGEYCDTMFFYNNSGIIMSMEDHSIPGKRTVTNFYDSGEIKRISKFITDGNKLKSDQYYDKRGNKISDEEFRNFLKDEWKNKPHTIDSTSNASEIPPSFPGGSEKMIQFIQENLVYPSKEKKKGISGICYISFIVEKDGSLSNLKVVKGIRHGEALDSEAIRVLKLMPKWTPAKVNGQVVSVTLNLPINFNTTNK